MDTIRGLGELSHRQLEAFCQRWHISALFLFGSVLRDDFRRDSDVDVIVEFKPGHVPGLAFMRMCDELSALVRHPVDVFMREDIERAKDSPVKSAILSTMINILVHQYDVVRHRLVWEVATTDIPALIGAIEPLIVHRSASTETEE